MGIERHQSDTAGLGDFQLLQYLSGYVVFFESGITKRDQMALDFSGKITAQRKVNRPDTGKGNPADNTARRSIIEKSLLDPSAVAELLRHVLIAPAQPRGRFFTRPIPRSR